MSRSCWMTAKCSATSPLYGCRRRPTLNSDCGVPSSLAGGCYAGRRACPKAAASGSPGPGSSRPAS
eukprot:2054315-Prymnesium_polylepis.2